MHPVFFDPGGRRWRRIIATLALMFLGLVCATAWVMPQALAPTWTAPLNQDPDYPRQLLAKGNPGDIPVLGDPSKNAFVRIALAKRVNGETVLADPFSDRIFRSVTAEEEVEIGDSTYVMERFGQPADGQLMLTFDDGPDPEFTGQILDILSAEGVPATFFDIGTNVVKHPELFQRTIREGHMVGNHTMTHLTTWNEGDARHRQELVGTDRSMRGVGEYASPLFRIPKGNPEENPVPLLHAQQLGYLHVNFDLDTNDWSFAPGEEVPVPELDGEGHIVLLHDGGGDRAGTVKMLPKLIAEAKAKGYTFTTLAPIIPEEYVPATNIDPDLGDDATAMTVAGFTVLPNVVIRWLFWFGLASLSIMSLLYITLALIGHRRQKRRQWRDLPDEDLPLVSVILPVFNEEPVVERTLTTLRASDYPNFEVIAIDDGSTDRTLQVLRDYAETWPQLRVLTQSNGGKSVASNHGIMAAGGEILVTLDGDTLFETQTIRMFARHFYDHDGKRPVGAVAGHVKVGNRCNVITAWQSLEYISGICVTRVAEGVAGAISIVPGACAAWRKEALQKAGGYSHDTLAEDADLTMSIQRRGYAVVQENRAVAWTEAPITVQGLAKQRLRWTYGNLQALWKNADMMFRPRYGALGMVALPYAMLATVIPLVFLPLTVVLAVLNIMAGAWHSIALFALFVAVVHAVICVLAVRMVEESPMHLLFVPIYRVIYEPLRAYLLYASLIQALKGRMVGWYKPDRTNSVFDLDSALTTPSQAERV